MSSRILLWVFAALVLASPAGAVSDNWLAMVRGRFEAAQTYPRSAQLRGETCTARISVSIDSGGRIIGYDVIQPCLVEIFNREINNLKSRIDRLPPPPDQRSHSFTLTLIWADPVS